MPFCGMMRFQPAPLDLPWGRILDAWVAAAFRPKACRAELERIIREAEIDPALFEPAELERGGICATSALLYDAFGPERAWRWSIDRTDSPPVSFEVEPDGVDQVAALIRAVARAENASAFRDLCDSELDPDLIDELCRYFSDEPAHGVWRDPRGPGILRREHASLLIRSRTTSIVTDPQSLHLTWTTNMGRYPSERPDPVQAVAITHGHGDHWHLPSVLRVADVDETLVLTPPVPRANLLCTEDFQDTCRRVGQRSAAPDWYSTVAVGDVEIDVLPFYGEQPTRSAPGAEPGLRNWGSCYRFNCEDFSAMILVDSGTDPLGDALEAVARSVAKRGPVDVLLSCCLGFPEGINMGLPHYALTLPFSRLEQIFRDREQGRFELITLGEHGVSEACRIAGARYLLPYAHGFSGLRNDPRSEEGGGADEAATLAKVVAALGTRSVATEAASWKPGDFASLERRSLSFRRA
jgi:hypothetical protein